MRGFLSDFPLLWPADEEAENRAGEGDEKRADDGRDDPGHREAEPQLGRYPCRQQQHEAVQHEQEEPEREDHEGAGEPREDRAHERVQEPEHDRHPEQADGAAAPLDPGDVTDREPERERDDDEPQQEAHQGLAGATTTRRRRRGSRAPPPSAAAGAISSAVRTSCHHGALASPTTRSPAVVASTRSAIAKPMPRAEEPASQSPHRPATNPAIASATPSRTACRGKS